MAEPEGFIKITSVRMGYRQAVQPARVVLCDSRGVAAMLGGRQTDQYCRLPPVNGE